MGWQESRSAWITEIHHRTDRRTFNKDIKRAEALTELGWTDVRVTVEDTEGGIIWRVSAAAAAPGNELTAEFSRYSALSSPFGVAQPSSGLGVNTTGTDSGR